MCSICTNVCTIFSNSESFAMKCWTSESASWTSFQSRLLVRVCTFSPKKLIFFIDRVVSPSYVNSSAKNSSRGHNYTRANESVALLRTRSACNPVAGPTAAPSRSAHFKRFPGLVCRHWRFGNIQIPWQDCPRVAR